ncbi:MULTISPECIES: 2'-5' RNA ligase family protein [Methylobacterium]|jgi:2'-5' RNA ligase|uniref:2'-5' RNA ligase family protein n=1 Tax=Methylobacterium TaxID=407 RepID=UPI0008E15453|nr:MULTISPECIES: 2'-5' RNA ligase family protein [Methylobacterium]MBZ6415678.1 2'-5' RNA ligase family protein [Methylobacterium sp.]MBK3396875.1 2'-5' RNA ligase family protein [Methylobacterium ajmalii]MBK3409286.1 2'-5' RNA ligase family protein [Methylobacterium ajmalii]MBK3423448.1 2'-5' RNA ligase family protein [Methylobacterium ajmalii]SFF61410.1 2'-5' RNA ligase [Methylobacterium sp. yr596]
MSQAPLILTLELDEAAFAEFDGRRRRHFPPALNKIPAHVTLFHHLPGEEERAVVETLVAEVRAESPMPVEVAGLRFIGRGVAYTLESGRLSALRGRLARTFEPWLTPQDRQGYRPHVTVQNKVAPEEARGLHRELEASFVPRTITGTGLLLWRYLGGPWEARGRFPFGGA